MNELCSRIDVYLKSMPPVTGRTFHELQPETLLSECRTQIEIMFSLLTSAQAALLKIAEIEHEDIDAPKTEREAKLWACLAMCVEIAETEVRIKR
jgi:hypothetical protein